MFDMDLIRKSSHLGNALAKERTQSFLFLTGYSDAATITNVYEETDKVVCLDCGQDFYKKFNYPALPNIPYTPPTPMPEYPVYPIDQYPDRIK